MSKTNLHLFTGKGGVGKTTLAMAFAHYLKEQGEEVIYTSITSSNIKDKTIHESHHDVLNALGIPYLDLVLADCAEAYIAKKMNSKLIASAVVKTPFFKSLINMIPGFSYLIFMGRILEEIHYSNQKKIIVFDSPASGHTLTLLESTQNFHDIFQSGLLFEDTKKMLELIHGTEFMKIHIVTNLTEMSLSEGIELKGTIKNLGFQNIATIANNAMVLIPHIEEEKNLPDFINGKIKLEKELLNEFQNKIQSFVPHVPLTDSVSVINALAPYMESLVKSSPN
ncbi:MAG: ArsA-related P-loop ATPase [Bacteriovoracaceae bacterium]